ncbi:putative glycosyltransferase EpsJ [Blautia hansenii]|uniref:Putative glycosyltransferase EpsJ n=1 Tax=Blautia hansenii TaxID=1322 RepID=A0A6N2RG32_BLAHA
MGNKPLLSVIVPVYNTRVYLERCIESLVKQTYLRLEIILVDDGSKDGSEKYCDQLVGQYPNIKVVHKKMQD